MRRSLVRALTGAWLLWFTTTVVQEPRARVCPVHAAQPAAAHHSHGAQHHGQACDCPDECRCGSPATMAAEPVAAVPHTAFAPLHDVPTVASASPARSSDHVLPFANGPPLPHSVTPLVG